MILHSLLWYRILYFEISCHISPNRSVMVRFLPRFLAITLDGCGKSDTSNRWFNVKREMEILQWRLNLEEAEDKMCLVFMFSRLLMSVCMCRVTVTMVPLCQWVYLCVDINTVQISRLLVTCVDIYTVPRYLSCWWHVQISTLSWYLGFIVACVDIYTVQISRLLVTCVDIYPHQIFPLSRYLHCMVTYVDIYTV